jgi:peptide/nickel transport system ATP-binding protein
MENRIILDVRHLTTVFHRGKEKSTVVENLSFSLYERETLGIVGESGSGKSVTALSIMGLIPSPDGNIEHGEILFYDREDKTSDLLCLHEKEMQEIRGKKISMIFQEPMTSLNPVFSCGMQVSEVLRKQLKMDRKKARKRTLELFSEVRLPDPGKTFSSYPHQLSGGQRQRVMIAMAVACQPKVLIADEPTTALDVTVQKTILGLMKEIQRKYGMSILFITHDLGLVADLADRILVMYRGKAVEESTPGSLFRTPRHPYTRGLINCRPPSNLRLKRLPTVEDFLGKNVIPGQGTEEDTGSLFSFGNIESAGERLNRHLSIYSQHPILEVRNLKTWFPSSYSIFGRAKQYNKAVNDMTFEVYPGETLGIVGESGCGKTTLGRTILHLVKARSGKVLFEKRELGRMPADQIREIRRNLQIIFQDPYSSLNPRQTIGDILEEPMKVHRIGTGKKIRRQRATELLKMVGLEEIHLYRYPHEFSGGQRQRICIARALSLEPRLLICDESVSSLDVSVQAQVLNLLNELKREYHFTYVFISHDLSVVRFMSDRLIVMKEGRIEEAGNADKIYSNPHSEYTRQLLEAIPKINIRPTGS